MDPAVAIVTALGLVVGLLALLTYTHVTAYHHGAASNDDAVELWRTLHANAMAELAEVLEREAHPVEAVGRLLKAQRAAADALLAADPRERRRLLRHSGDGGAAAPAPAGKPDA